MEWLRNLGLSKYEEIFIKEEVDWETLQWLTEEVISCGFVDMEVCLSSIELKLWDLLVNWRLTLTICITAWISC
jgi:hypothetical protein